MPDDIYRKVFEKLAEKYNHISADQHFPTLSFDPFLVNAADFILKSHDFSDVNDSFISDNSNDK